MAVLAYFGILVIIPLLMVKNDPFVKYHIRQGLVLLIALIIAFAISTVPIFGWFLGWILWLGCFVLMIMGIINAVNGQTKELPLIGQFGSKFNF
jgi:uncharacterized membrane protein